MWCLQILTAYRLLPVDNSIQKIQYRSHGTSHSIANYETKHQDIDGTYDATYDTIHMFMRYRDAYVIGP